MSEGNSIGIECEFCGETSMDANVLSRLCDGCGKAICYLCGRFGCDSKDYPEIAKNVDDNKLDICPECRGID